MLPDTTVFVRSKMGEAGIRVRFINDFSALGQAAFLAFSLHTQAIPYVWADFCAKLSIATELAWENFGFVVADLESNDSVVHAL